MGTRHLIAVRLDGEYRIAQYGQWDGYPSGQGVGVLGFLRRVDRAAFADKLRAASFYTQDELEVLAKDFETKYPHGGWSKHYPHLSRDAGSEILQMVLDAPPGIKLKNSIDFAADSIFCEYAYVIDLDKEQLEVFKGFNKEPLAESERFYGLKHEGKDGQQSYDGKETYYPVRQVGCFSLNSLPDDKAFCAQIDPPEIDEPAEEAA